MTALYSLLCSSFRLAVVLLDGLDLMLPASVPASELQKSLHWKAKGRERQGHSSVYKSAVHVHALDVIDFRSLTRSHRCRIVKLGR